MHSTSALYQTLLRDPLHYKRVKLDIAGQEYSEADIVSAPRIVGQVYSTPTIGVCSARSMTTEVFPKGAIPKQAKIQIYIQLVKGAQASEWIKKGEFFISTRQVDKVSGALSLTTYDAMLKSDQVWLTSDYDTENWPMPVADAVDDIACRMGVDVDSRTVLDTSFPVEYPVDENGDMTMRDVLSMIAVANAGNWIITDEGKLRLLRFGELEAETSLLCTEDGDVIMLGEVALVV